MNLSVTLYPAQVFFILLLFTGILLSAKRAAIIKSKKRIQELENEMLACHSEILSLQREISALRYTALDVEQHRLYAVDKKKEA